MSSGQSARKGSSVEPGLPKTFLMPTLRSSSSVACLTVGEVAFFGGMLLCPQGVAVIARSKATKQSRVVGVAQGCFAPLAMTGKTLPRRRPLHRRLAGIVRGPQLHAGAIVIGVDGELAAFEQGLHAAIGEFFRRPAAAELGRQLDDERCLQRAVEDQSGIALDLGDIVAVVMDSMTVEGQRRIAEQQHRIGDMRLAVLRDWRWWRGFWRGGWRAAHFAIDDVLVLADGDAA